MIERNISSLINENTGFMLHASSVNFNDKAIVFLGHSSSGKSTISQILSKEFSLISDDKICLFRNNENWFLRSGDEESKLYDYGEDINISSGIFPIESFVRIYKSDQNMINEIESSLLCKYLIDAVFEVDNQRKIKDTDLRKKWFRFSVDIAKKYQGWHFYFKKESNIIGIIKKTFEK